MLSKSHRLVTADFDAVMEKGRVTHSSLFLMRHVAPVKDTRVSAVVSKKVGKTAVIRNAMRRKIYEAVRALPISSLKGAHAINIAKNEAMSADYKALSGDIKDLFVKAGLLR